MDFPEAIRLVTNEINLALDSVDAHQVQALADALSKAKRIFVTGQGRSGLVARSFAMRLMHLGLSAHVVGETTATAIEKGDLLLSISCSGETQATCYFMKKAKFVGAAGACVTADWHCRLARMCDTVVAIPLACRRQTRRPPKRKASAQFASTLFEQCSLILLDALSLVLMSRRKQSHEQMMSRHSNLE